MGTAKVDKSQNYTLQYSHQENPMSRGAWQAIVHGVTKSQTKLSWSGSRIPSPGELSDPGITLGSPALQMDSLPSKPSGMGAGGPPAALWEVDDA